MRTLLALLALLVAGPLPGAAADPPAADPAPDAPPGDFAARLRALAQPAEAPDGSVADPFLHLDAHLQLTVDRLDLTVDRFARHLALGPRGRLGVQTQWQSGNHLTPVHGWHTALSGSYTAGGLTLAGSVGVEHSETELGRSTLVTTGVSLGRSFRLARSVRGWAGITLGHRRWVGAPPAGEADTTQLMLSAKLSY